MTFTARALFGSRRLLVPILLLSIFSLKSESSEAHRSVETFRLLDAVTAALPAKVSWSVSAMALDSDEAYLDIGSEESRSLTPGSLIKLFTTAAVLDANAEEKINLDTVFLSDGAVSRNVLTGDLCIKGGGNAFLSGQDLNRAAEKIASLGIAEITGSIVVDDTLFEVRGVKSGYIGPAYAPPSALGLDLHTISITVDGNAVRISPENDAVQVLVSIDGRPGLRQIDDLLYEANGLSPVGPAIRKRFPLKDPALYAGGVFRTLLGKNGITVRGDVRKGKLPPKALELVRIPSRPLEEIVLDTNSHSLNVAAENLFLHLAARKYGAPGTAPKGVLALRAFLAGMGLASSQIMLNDGSGVSSANKLSASEMVLFLRKASSKPWFKTFYASMPLAGNDRAPGAKGFKNGRIRAKIGQLPDAYCLAGYIDRQDGKRLAFAYLVNGEGAGVTGAASAAGTEVLRHLSGE